MDHSVVSPRCFKAQHRQVSSAHHLVPSTSPGWPWARHRQLLTWATVESLPGGPQTNIRVASFKPPEHHPITSKNDINKGWTQKALKPCSSRSYSAGSPSTQELTHCTYSHSSHEVSLSQYHPLRRHSRKGTHTPGAPGRWPRELHHWVPGHTT